MNWKKAIEIFKIYEKYQESSIENCDLLPIEIVDLGRRWIKHPKRPPLYLYGIPGCGKTYFALALLRGLIEFYNHPFFDCIFEKSQNMDDEFLYKPSHASEREITKKYIETSFLFLDDLGVERTSERMKRQFYSIIDERVGNNKVTVITSNLSKENIVENVGERVVSRLEHFLTIEFKKNDLRKNLDIIIP